MNLSTIVIGAALLGATTAVPVHAVGGHIAPVDGDGTVYVSENVGGTAPLSGTCKYVRQAAGVGGSGITYQIAGEGTAAGAYKGIPVVATGVRCRFFLGSSTYASGPEYLPGSAAETNTAVDSNDASGGAVCVTVYAVLRQTPPGEVDNLIDSGEQC